MGMSIDEMEYLAIARKVQKVGRLMRMGRDADLKSLGLTSNQSETLSFVSSTPGCTINDIKNYLGISHQAACALVDRMKSTGLLDTKVSKNDGRAREVVISDLGRRTLAGVEMLGINAGHRATDGIDYDEVLDLSRILDRMLENLSKEKNLRRTYKAG